MMRSSARKRSYESINWRFDSNEWYFFSSFFMSMTRAMRPARSFGKETFAMISLNDLCWVGLMRQIDSVGDVLIECGRIILAGFSRFCGTMCFFVVVMSHTGSVTGSLSVSRRFLDFEGSSCFCLESRRCLRRAFDALCVYIELACVVCGMIALT